MTEIERLTKVREMLGEARRYVGLPAFTDLAREAIDGLDDSDSEVTGSLSDILVNAAAMRQVDPDAARGAIDYVRCQLALAIGRLERDERERVGMPPTPPPELWMLWFRMCDHDVGWVYAIDGASGMEGYLAFPSKEIATGSASAHHVRYGIECFPVRVR